MRARARAGSPEFMATPTRLGHEVAGELDAVGSRVLGLQVGEQVTCRYVWGAFAEYIVCKPFNVLTLPRSIPALEVSLIEVRAVARAPRHAPRHRAPHHTSSLRAPAHPRSYRASSTRWSSRASLRTRRC